MINWVHAGPPMAASFFGSAVEGVEAMTIVLAVATVRGWRPALTGGTAGLVTLATLVAFFGSTIAAIPVGYLQIAVGTALLLFGIRWLRKAVLRSSGVVALHDESAIFATETTTLRRAERSVARWDLAAVLTAYKAVVLEGVEVVVIVIGVGAVGNMLLPASIGALAACVLVVTVGAFLQRPLARLPENTLKYGVGIMLTSFGWFWFGEGIGIRWPYGDAAILGLMAVLYVASALMVRSVHRLHAVPQRNIESRS